MHAIRRHKISALAWSFAHLPFIMAFVLGGGGLARLVLSHDAPGSHLDWLTETYQARSEDHIPDGIRWFYCGGFGIALLLMGMISISHVHKENEHIRLTKKWRLAVRFLVSIVCICLPLAHELTSLSLVATVTGLLVLLLIAEVWAASNTQESLFGRDRPCRYTGRCSRGMLHEIIRSGKEVDMDQLVSDKGKDSGYTVGP